MQRTITFVTAHVTGLLVTAAAYGANIAIPATSEASAQSERQITTNRFLFEFALPDKLAAARIDRATLVLDVDRANLESDAVPLRVLPLREEWSTDESSTLAAVASAHDSAGISWLVLRADSGLVQIDVTAIVDDWILSRYPNRGILVMPFEDSEAAVSLREYSGRTSVVRAELHVSFRARPEEIDLGR